MSTTYRIYKPLSGQNAMVKAMVEANIVEDRKVLVEERVAERSLKAKAKGKGEQTPRIPKIPKAEFIIVWMAAMAIYNNIKIEDVVLFLDELSLEEREERRTAFMRSIKEKKEAAKAKAVSFLKRANKALKRFVSSVMEDSIINKGYMALLIKKTLVAEARVAEVSR